jgi:hypothetical protein
MAKVDTEFMDHMKYHLCDFCEMFLPGEPHCSICGEPFFEDCAATVDADGNIICEVCVRWDGTDEEGREVCVGPDFGCKCSLCLLRYEIEEDISAAEGP